MRNFCLAVLMGLVSSSTAVAEELFKGVPPEGVFSFGLGAGLAPLGSSGGFVSVGNLAGKIVHTGFVPDINNQIWIEMAGGFHVGFNGGLVSGIFSTHLRWDFILNPEWTLFAAAGVGGSVSSFLASTTVVIHPRAALGAIYYFIPQLGLRFDVSHEWTTVGLHVRLP